MRAHAPLSGEEFERALIDAAAFEAVPQGSRERVALGLGLPLSCPSAEAGLAGPRPASVGTGPGRTLSLGLSRGWVKATCFAVLGGLLVGGSMSVGMPGDNTREAPAVASGVDVSNVPSAAVSSAAASGAVAPEAAPIARPLAEPTSVGQPPARNTPASRPTRVRDARDVVPARSSTSASRAVRAQRSAAAAALAPPAPSLVGSGDLLAEVKQLDEVRRRLQGGQPAMALRGLDAFEQAFPRGELVLEARVLKVESLFAAARPEEARALARAILAAPGSERYRVELERLLERSRR